MPQQPEQAPEMGLPATEAEHLKQRAKEREASVETEQSPERKPEAVKEEIQEHLQEYQQASQAQLPVATTEDVQQVSQYSPSQQVSTLISLAFDKGLPKAISVAQSLDNPALLDEFHDALVDRYYQELVNQGIISS